MFSQLVRVSLAVATVGLFSPLAAIAQPETTQPYPAGASISELAQMPAGEANAVSLPEGTLVLSQSDRIAVRVYTSNGAPLLNLFNKQTGVTELRGVPVTAESTSAGVTYRYAGERTVEIAIAASGEQTITLNGTPQQGSGAVTGTVSYLPKIALPPTAVVEISLVDVSRADAPATVLASEQIVSGGRQVPFPFTLLYDPGQIDQRFSYAIQSRITVEGDLQFVSTSRFPVITNGNPNNVAVQVDPTDQPSDQTMTDQAQLKNTNWQLEQIQYNDDKLLESDSPNNYTIKFMDNGQLSIRADCNQAQGSFTEDGSSLSIDLGPTTLAACPPESISQDYLQALQEAGGYFLQDGDLYIDLKLDTGTMRFSMLNN
ncbi:MAG: YbaY family lipoprotein [Phormidesmis sp.]